MVDISFQYFELLKREVVKSFRKSYPGASVRIEDWKGQTIVLFQEHLLETVNEHISEKWFYNHMKSKSKVLPRIDMLNLLSRYCGYADWQDFEFKNKKNIILVAHENKSNRIFLVVPLVVILVLFATYLLFKILNTKEYRFCFVSADTKQPIKHERVELEMLSDKDESSRLFLSDSTGCIVLKTDNPKIEFIVSSPYYHTDTVKRTLKKFDRDEVIQMHTNDYALMLHYFSNSDIEAWNRRRNQLDSIFADGAIIYEVYEGSLIGMEMYTKWEFINRLTLPSKSLTQIDVLNMEYKNDKIIKLRISPRN
jgi:hypothetical protein